MKLPENNVKTPWAPFMEGVPLHLDYFQGSMYEAVSKTAIEYPNYTALKFMGRSISYAEMMACINRVAMSLKTIGVRENDKVTIAMPNCPQAIYSLYAINRIGAIANMIHPLSAENEIEYYLTVSDSITVITLDQFYNKFEAIRKRTPKVVNIVLASIKDELSLPLRYGYMLTEGRKQKKIPPDAPVILWHDFIRMSRYCFKHYKVLRKSDDPAVVLYSGGTTGKPKGIVLTNGNFNAAGQQVIAAAPTFHAGDSILAAMPIFHGFGLGVCIHCALTQGACSILMPRFTPQKYAEELVKNRCNYTAGVPTLYEKLLHLDNMQDADLSALKGVFCGGDHLSIELKNKLDAFLKDHGAQIQMREGYGATETLTAAVLTPPNQYKPGSIGIPFPDNYVKIVVPDTEEEVPLGQEGEILMAGPAIMKEYMNEPEETAKTLRRHKDGLIWAYTGDLGVMDEDGFIYFKGRAKRMIISSGYNIYPAMMENTMDAHVKVQMSCFIGLPDPVKIQKVKAFVQLASNVPANEETKAELMEYCRKNFAKYAMPYDIEFREALPQTMIGKVNFRLLEEEEMQKLENQKGAAPAAEEKPFETAQPAQADSAVVTAEKPAAKPAAPKAKGVNQAGKPRKKKK